MALKILKNNFKLFKIKLELLRSQHYGRFVKLIKLYLIYRLIL